MLEQFVNPPLPNGLPKVPPQRPPAATAARASTINKDAAVLATVILPAYNEAEALPSVLTSLFGVLDEQYEIIVVDDASTDATAAIARSYPCWLLRHERNHGKGAAVRTGTPGCAGQIRDYHGRG